MSPGIAKVGKRIPYGNWKERIYCCLAIDAGTSLPSLETSPGTAANVEISEIYRFQEHGFNAFSVLHRFLLVEKKKTVRYKLLFSCKSTFIALSIFIDPAILFFMVYF